MHPESLPSIVLRRDSSSSTSIAFIHHTLYLRLKSTIIIFTKKMGRRSGETDKTGETNSNLPELSPIPIPKSSNNKTKLKINIKRWHGVAKWTWGVGDEDDVCIVCQSAFEGVAPGVKFPGDECPVVVSIVFFHFKSRYVVLEYHRKQILRTLHRSPYAS